MLLAKISIQGLVIKVFDVVYIREEGVCCGRNPILVVAHIIFNNL